MKKMNERQTESEIQIQRYRDTEIQRERQTDRQTDRQTEREARLSKKNKEKERMK